MTQDAPLDQSALEAAKRTEGVLTRLRYARSALVWTDGNGSAIPSAPVVDSALLEAINALSRRVPASGGEHPDDLAVDRFAAAMKEKLAKKRAEGRGGWERKDECTAEFLSELLRGHVAKGDPLDVGNLAMMLHQRGERILTVEPEAGEVTVKPLVWSQSRVFGTMKRRGFGLFGEFVAFIVDDLTAAEIASKEAAAELAYAKAIRSAIAP